MTKEMMFRHPRSVLHAHKLFSNDADCAHLCIGTSLDFTQLIRRNPSLFLFAGQIVLVEGVNSTGKRMMVTNIAVDVPPMRARTPAIRLRHFNTGKGFLENQVDSMYRMLWVDSITAFSTHLFHSPLSQKRGSIPLTYTCITFGVCPVGQTTRP